MSAPAGAAGAAAPGSLDLPAAAPGSADVPAAAAGSPDLPDAAPPRPAPPSPAPRWTLAPVDRAPADPRAALPGPGEWPRPVPDFARGTVPAHVALVMDGNGRWANARGLPRTEGHRAGEYALMDTIAGAIDAGVRYLSVYTFSTENWKRSPAEVRFIMGYASDVLARRTPQLSEWGVHVRWSGREPRLWRSVIHALRDAEEETRGNSTLDLVMCVNYGGRAEIADAARSIARDVEAGRLKPAGVTERVLARHLYLPDVPDVDLMVRTSGEKRLSNYLLWQMAYAEMMFVDTPWPAFDRGALWDCLLDYVGRDRRFGGARDALSR